MFISSFDGTKLYLNKETTPGDTCVCVVVHGLCEHQGRYDYLAEKFHQNGIGTYRFDHRGHGRSEGERTYYKDYNDLLGDLDTVIDLAIAENPGKPVFLLGHSMGGFAVALYGILRPEKGLRGIVASGARTWGNGGPDLPADADPHMMLPNELGPGVCSVAEVVDWYAKDPYNTKTYTMGLCYALDDGAAYIRAHAEEFRYPVLLMHGEKDGLVAVRDTQDFFAAVGSGDKQMKIFGGLLHEIFNEYCRDEVIGDAVRWICNRA